MAIAIIVIQMFGFRAPAQSENLVLNYSFEEYYKCPHDYTPQDRTHKLLPEWSYPTIATPDYFNKCSTNPVITGVPKNFAGESYPKTGNGYVGAILTGERGFGKLDYREYIQGKLKTPLEKGKQYCVMYSYKLASYSRFAVDRLSLYFSDIEIKNELEVNLPYKPQFNSKEGLFLDNIDEWEQFCAIYTAQGGEKYFIVGNFRSYENTNYVATDKTIINVMNKAYAYYYFDDFVIKALDNCTDCPCVQHDFEAKIIAKRYTGGFDPITGKVDRIINDGYVKIGMIGGTPPYNVKWSNGMTGTVLKNLPAGKYTYTAYDSYNCQSAGSIEFTEPEIVTDEFEEGLKNIEEGSSIVLENIFFEFNKTDLLPESYAELNKVVDFMLKNHIQLIEISGHTDNEGSESYNQKLSEGRANSVIGYLAGNGVPMAAMRAIGYGESRPIETNLTEEGRAINRRVEFTLLKK